MRRLPCCHRKRQCQPAKRRYLGDRDQDRDRSNVVPNTLRDRAMNRPEAPLGHNTALLYSEKSTKGRLSARRMSLRSPCLLQMLKRRRQHSGRCFWVTRLVNRRAAKLTKDPASSNSTSSNSASSNSQALLLIVPRTGEGSKSPRGSRKERKDLPRAS